MEHTKGEWRWKQDRGNNVYEHKVFVAYKEIAFLKGNDCTAEEVRANAALIAAAPDLLEACESLVNSLSENQDDYTDAGYYRQVMDKMEQASKAIAKAKA